MFERTRYPPSDFFWGGSHDPIQEDCVQKVLADHNFYYPVPVTVQEDAPLKDFPWIKPTDYLKTLSRTNDMGHLLGGHSLNEAKPLLLRFWERFRTVYPNHQLWDHHGARDLSKCIPIFLHGDEGTSFKKGGILVFSFQGAIGLGTSKRARDLENNLRALGEGIPLNFLSTGLQTRMLICVCPKDFGFKLQLTMFLYHVVLI